MSDDIPQDEVIFEEQSRLNRYFSTFVLVIVIFVPCLIIGSIGNIFQEGIWFIPGDDKHFDPIIQYDIIDAHAGNDTHFIGFEAFFVRRDGTVNPTESTTPRVIYHFYQTQNTNNYQLISVEISRPYTIITDYINGGPDRNQYLNLGMDRNRNSETTTNPNNEALPPRCSLQDFWVVTMAEYDIDIQGFASVRYDADGYRFSIDDTAINLNFDTNCERVS